MVLWPALGNFMGEKRELTGGGLPWVFRLLGVSEGIGVSGQVRVCCGCYRGFIWEIPKKGTLI